MRVTEGEYDDVEVRDEMGNHFYGVVIAIEDEETLDTNFTEFSDRTFYLHVRINETLTTDYDYIVNNYPEELIIDKNEKPLKGPVVRIKWREVEEVYDW